MVKMKRKITTLKIMILSMVLTSLLSCGNNTPQKGFKVKIHSKSSSLGVYVIDCDSFNMKSQTEIDVWVNGSKNTVFANEITPYTNCY